MVSSPSRTPTTAHDLASYIGVVPGYQILFGKKATLDQLIAIVQSYSVVTWLSFLSRLQLLLAPPHTTEIDRHRAAFKAVIGPDVGRRLQEFERDKLRHGNCLTFVEPQITTLQQLAIQHAFDGEESDLTPSDFDQISIALLATWDLMDTDPETSTSNNLNAKLMQAVMRNTFEWTPAVASRAYDAYAIGQKEPSEAVEILHRAFLNATNAKLEDYVLGGLEALILAESDSPDDLARGWKPVGPVSSSDVTRPRSCLEEFSAIRCAKLDSIRALANKCDGKRSIPNFSLIAMSTFPMIELPKKGRFVMCAARVADALFEGVRHAIQTAFLAGKSDVPNLAELGNIFGQVFEQYIQRILAEAFTTRFLPLPASPDNKRSDGLILYPDRVIVYEIKSKHARAATRRAPLTLQERGDELRTIGIPYAAEQLAATISSLRAGDLDEHMGKQYDWTITPIVPVIITAEKVPLVWNAWAQLESLVQPLAELPLQDQIARVRFLDISDVELLPDLVRTHDVSQVMLRWANSSETYDRPLLRHLNVSGIGSPNDFLSRRFRRVISALAEHHGIDASKLKREKQKSQ